LSQIKVILFIEADYESYNETLLYESLERQLSLKKTSNFMAIEDQLGMGSPGVLSRLKRIIA
jgi:hypothetical protein